MSMSSAGTDVTLTVEHCTIGIQERKPAYQDNNVRSVREADMFQEIRISQVKQLNVKQYSTLAWGNNIPNCPYCHFRKVLNLLCLADFLVTFANEIKRLRGIQCDVSRLMNRPDST